MKRIWVILTSVFGLILIFNLSRELIRIPKAGERLRQAQERVEQLKIKNWQLKQEKQYQETNDFLEKEIRNKLMLNKKGEIVVILPEEVLKKVATPSAAGEEKQELPIWQQWLELFGSARGGS